MNCQGKPHAHRATRRNLGKRMTIRARISGNHAGPGSTACEAWHWRNSGLHIPTRIAIRSGFRLLRSVANRQKFRVATNASSLFRP
jgi:hypothetical protein